MCLPRAPGHRAQGWHKPFGPDTPPHSDFVCLLRLVWKTTNCFCLTLKPILLETTFSSWKSNHNYRHTIDRRTYHRSQDRKNRRKTERQRDRERYRERERERKTNRQTERNFILSIMSACLSVCLRLSLCLSAAWLKTLVVAGHDVTSLPNSSHDINTYVNTRKKNTRTHTHAH